MRTDKRIRINKRMMAWSDGRRVNIIPSLRHEVDDYGHLMYNYHTRIDEGYLVDCGPCTMAREESQMREYEADRLWDNGSHLEALNEMIRAALYVLPDDEPLFEDMQWLNPWENVYWHPNIKEFLRLNRRCRDYCRQDPRLWPLYRDSWPYRASRDYLDDLRRWRYDA